MELVGALAEILAPKGLQRGPSLELREDQKGSRCEPIAVRAPGEVLALRLGHDDWARQLAELPKDRSVRRLPDYLLFGAPSRRDAQRGLRLKVVVCEIKSSQTGSEAALPRVRLGHLLARYLVSLAALHLKESTPSEGAVLYGAVIALPSALYHRGETKPGRGNRGGEAVDPIAHIPIKHVSGGGEIDLDLHC